MHGGNNMNNLNHINCGGELVEYKTTEAELTQINRQRRKDKLMPWDGYDLFRCVKCKGIVHIITCPSYADFVEQGRIKKDVN